MDLAPDYDEFIASLIAHGVDFVVVGAYALAFHGVPRFTGDLDVLVRPTRDNTVRLLDAVRAFGFPVAELTPEALMDGRRMLQNKRAAGRPKDLADIDALSGGEGE
jgi:hypothetical protein